MADLDMPYLLFAWQDESPETIYYLDTELGSVEMVQQDLLDIDELTNTIERDHERYLYLPKPDPRQLRNDLQEFIASVADQSLSRVLLAASEAPDPLHACKTVLAKSPDGIKSWEDFRTQKVQERVNKWLAANFITPDK